MNCPYCQQAGTRRALHQHLVERHADALELGLDDARSALYYSLRCPACAFALRQTVRPRSTDTTFLAEYRREIGLVAFDILLYHLEAEHEEAPPDQGDGAPLLHIPLVQE